MNVPSFRSRTVKKCIGVLAFAMLIGWTSVALAIKPDPSAPGGHLLIKEVEVVVDAVTPQTTFTITGQDFDFTNLSDIVVTLGEIGPLVIDPSSNSTVIVATLNAAIDPGEYLLTVSTGSGQSKHDEFDLTVGGGIGPQGPQGPPGPAGPEGPEGPQGPAGEGAQSLVPQGVVENFTVPGKDSNGNSGLGVHVLTCPDGFFAFSPGYLYPTGDTGLGILHVFDLHVDLSSRSMRIGVRNPNVQDVTVTAYLVCYKLQ